MVFNFKRILTGVFIFFFLLFFYFLKLDNLFLSILFLLFIYDLFYSKIIFSINYSFLILIIIFSLYLFFYQIKLFYLICPLIIIFFIYSKNYSNLFFLVILLCFFLISYQLISHDRNIFYLIIVLSFINDTSAYFSGKYFKGPLILPKISPNKTISGTLISFLISFSMMSLLDFNIFMSLLLSTLFFLSDILFSIVKRRNSLKDFSNLLAGHGGILDRFDSIILPIIFFSIFGLV